MFSQILIPIDGSDPSYEAAEFGLELAKNHGATIHGLYVIKPVRLGGFSAGMEPASAHHDVVDEQRKTAEKALDQLGAKAEKYDVELITDTRIGQPHEEIIAYTKENDIDGIVIGTHGRSGTDRILLGSVAEKVVRKSPVPVTTVGTKES